MIVNATNARKNFYKLLKDVTENSSTVSITNTNGKDAVLISGDDWRTIEETLYLNSIPGLTEDLIKLKHVNDDEFIDEKYVIW